MPRTVLQIDDEPALSAALHVRLRAAGLELVSASDGPSGLAAAEEHQPDAILLDVRMPGMDGYEVCRRLKGTPHLASIPVIFLSANADQEGQRRARELGAAAFIAKPYEADELVATINSAIDGQPSRNSRSRSPNSNSD